MSSSPTKHDQILGRSEQVNKATFEDHASIKHLSNKNLTEGKAYQLLRRLSTNVVPNKNQSVKFVSDFLPKEILQESDEKSMQSDSISDFTDERKTEIPKIESLDQPAR